MVNGEGVLPELTKGKLIQFASAIIANLVAVTYGMVQGWPSPSLPILRTNETEFGESVTVEQESWLGSLVFLGAFVSAPGYSYINQNLGRKVAGYFSAAPFIIGWLLIIFATSINLLYVARFVLGFGLSGTNVFITMYVGEISEDSVRGALGNLRGLISDIGIIIVYLVGPYLSIQNMGILSITIPTLFLFGYFWLPESPMFSLGKGNSQSALNAYIWLRGGDSKLACEEMVKLEAVVKNRVTDTKEPTLLQLLSVRGTRKALLIALVLAVVQQFSGMNIVFSYCATIFEMTGSNLSPYISSLVFSFVNFSGSIFAFFCADITGRRLILISTQILQGICLGLLGIYLYLRYLGTDVSSVGILPVICISFYCFCVVAGPANLFYVILSEIFRPEARGVAMSFTTSVLWMLAFLSTKFYSSMVDLMETHGCFSLFATISFAGAIFTYFQLPETKNRSLESILRELNGDPLEDSESARA